MSKVIKNLTLSVLLVSLTPHCKLNITPNNENKPYDISTSDKPSSPISSDEQNIADNLSKFPDPNLGLSDYGFIRFDSNPNDSNSVYNNILVSGTSLDDLRQTKYSFEGQGFYSEYSGNEDLRNKILLDVKDNLESLAVSLNIEVSNNLLVSLTDYFVASLYDGSGYDITENGFIYFAEDSDKKYLLIDGFFKDTNNYKVDFLIDAPITFDLIKSIIDQRESNAFGQ